MGQRIVAIVTSLDNLPLLQVSVPILLDDPLVSEVIVVNQGSQDGTAEWLATVPVTAINRENLGAGPGRNAGLDAAGAFDYALMLDGGIRPLIGGTARMLDYLERTPEADVIGVEIPSFETDINRAWRRWTKPIGPGDTYRNTRLSHTAYCLTRARAWEGPLHDASRKGKLRFCEEGPFGQPGWGADDDEMAYRWNEAGIVIHVVIDVHPYRRGSGSFRRLFKETGIWPNQYGSTYEQRVVWLQQNWPQQQTGVQWGEPWLTVVVKGTSIEAAAAIIKAAHDGLQGWHFDGRWAYIPQPYSVVLWTDDPALLEWAEPRRLRQHHGNTTIVDGRIVRRNAQTEATWAGDFRVWTGGDPLGAVRENAHYWAVVESMADLERLLAYWERFPKETQNIPPEAKQEQVWLS